jgi:signal transduction histidine kinase
MPDSALLLCLAATLAIGGAIAWMTLTRPGRARLALALALAALGALVLGNLLLDGWQVFPHSIRQALVLAMIGFLALQTWELVERFNRALQSYRVNAAYFEQQLAVKRDELQATFAQLRDAERNEAVEEERRRIMREIHDGLGSTLVNAMALAKSGPTPPQLTQALQHSMDELRMAIDALQPHEDDLLTALGTLRSRIEPALKGAGIELVWRVEPVPRLPQLTAANTLHLYRFAQEAFANVVKHAGARSVTLATRHDAASGIVELTIDDDGCGWQPDAPGAQLGRGTHTMRLRAQQLGGELRIERRAEGGTRVALRLPVAATAEPPAAA